MMRWLECQACMTRSTGITGDVSPHLLGKRDSCLGACKCKCDRERRRGTRGTMKVTVFLAATTKAMFFLVGIVANWYGPKVASRFLERGEAYTEADLKELITTSPGAAREFSA